MAKYLPPVEGSTESAVIGPKWANRRTCGVGDEGVHNETVPSKKIHQKFVWDS